MHERNFTISWTTIGRVIAAGLIIFLVWYLLDILVLILISAMLATALYPLVMFLNKRLPLIVSILIIMILLLIPFIVLGVTLVPAFNDEFPKLLKTLDTILNKSPIIPPEIRNFDFTDYAQNAGDYLLQSTSFVTSVAGAVISVFFLTFYLIYDAPRLVPMITSLYPQKYRKRASQLLSDLGKVNGQYIRGNLLISVICGVILFVGLTVLGIPYALPLAIFAAIMDLLPLIGSTIGAIPAVIIGLSLSPFQAISVVGLYLIYQQIESALLAPSIYNKALKIYPSLGFIAVILGAALYGVIGAFLALPVAASLPVVLIFIRDYRSSK